MKKLFLFVFLMSALSLNHQAFAQPAPPASAGQPVLDEQLIEQAENILLQVTDQDRRELLGSLAAYPDDVLDAVFSASRYTPLLLIKQAHPDDQNFNSAAAYIYGEYPELFQTLTENPLATQVTGLYAEKDPAGTYQIIDEYRKNQNLVPTDLRPQQYMSTHGKDHSAKASPPSLPQPQVKVESESVEKMSQSAGELSQTVNEYTEQLDDLNQNIEDYNKNISELNDNIDEVQNSANEAQEALESGEVAKDARKYSAGAQLGAMGAPQQGASSAMPFGAVSKSGSGGGFGFGRQKSMGSSGMAWNSNQLPINRLQKQMSLGNKRLGSGFGMKQQRFMKMGGGPSIGGPGKMGGGKVGPSVGRGPGGPGGPGPRRPGPP